MTLDQLPPQVLALLLQLEDRASRLAEAADQAGDRAQQAREALAAAGVGAQMADLRRELDERHTLAVEARRRADAEMRDLSAVKVFLARLPDDAVLEIVEPPINGATLPQVRARTREVRSRLLALSCAAASPDDLRDLGDVFPPQTPRDPEQLIALHAELERLQRIEVALVRRAEQNGVAVQRSDPSISADILLGIGVLQ
jgi:hypothetical protein